MKFNRRFTLALVICLTVIMLLPVIPAAAQTNVKENQILGWDGYTWSRVPKGMSLRAKLVWMDDFMEAANVLASTVYSNAHWTKANGAGSGTATITAGANGLMVLDTLHAAQNNDVSLTFSTANFAIANNPAMEALIKPNSLTNCVFEVGWYVDTNDEILFRFDAAVSSTKWLLVYENNNGGEQVTTTSVSASASAYTDLKINVLSTGGAECYINGTLIKTYAASTVRDVAFKPRFYAKVTDAGHAAAKTLTIDFARLIQDR